MNSNFLIKNHFQEENDFFLSYINDKLRQIDHELSSIDHEEQKLAFGDESDRFILLNNRLSLMTSRKQFDNMKEHYYLALNYGKSKPLGSFSLLKKNKKQEKEQFSEEKDFQFQKKRKKSLNNVDSVDVSFAKPILSSLLNLIHVTKSLKMLKNQDEFLNYLYNNNMKLEELNEIVTFYKSCFSKSADKNFLTFESKLHFSSNMLEIYCDEKHPLHNHFKGIRQKIETIAKSPIFLHENPNHLYDQNILHNQNLNKMDLHNQSGSQSDDTRRVMKKNFHRNRANLENYDGDSEKSIHKSEREEVKEENEEDFIENKAKSDGENNENIEVEQLLNRPKFKAVNNNNFRPKANRLKKNKKMKKMFEDSGDHATGSASEKNYEESKTKIFSWGIRGLQKINSKNNKPPKGFDTDKDMKL